MKLKYFIIALLACCVVSTAEAKKKRSYSSNNDVVGITGDVGKLLNTNNPFGDSTLVYPKYQLNNIELNVRPVHIRKKSGSTKKNFDIERSLKELNDNKVGKKVLDFLLMRRNGVLSEKLLKERALMLINRTKSEEAEQGVLSKEDNLRDNILPILEENYIFFQERNRWIVFHVDIDEEIWKQVQNCWNDLARYDKIEVPISFVATGKGKEPVFSGYNKLLRKVSHKVTAFAIRGQIIGRNPLRAELPLASGVRNYDRIRVYRQSMNKKGEMKARKICTSRVTNINEQESRLYTIAGGYASYKKGDMAVLSKDKRVSHSFTGNYMDNSYGINYTFDKQFNLSQAGVSNHLLISLGGGIFKDHKKMLYVFDNNLHRSPYIADVSLGYGVGWTFAHRIQIMPYVMGQYEGLIFPIKDKDNNLYSNKRNSIFTNDEEIDSEINWISSIRIPAGVKLHVNLWYPVQLVLGAEYIFLVYKGKASEPDNKGHFNSSYETIEHNFLDINGWKRSGLNLYGGLRICL